MRFVDRLRVLLLALTVMTGVVSGAVVLTAPAQADVIWTGTGGGDAYFDPHDQGFGEFGYSDAAAGHGDQGKRTGSAALADIACPATKLCTYWDTFYHGAMYYYSVDILPNNHCIWIGQPWTNQISSMKNRSGRTVRFYTNGSCNSVLSWTLVPGENAADLGLTVFNDNFESVKVVS